MPDFFAGQRLTAGVLNGALAALLSGKSSQDSVATTQATTSTSYTDLATAGPTVTLTSAGTLALVLFGCASFSNSATETGQAMSFAVSGATTISASDTYARIVSHNNNAFGFNVMNFAVVTITPGSNTFTAKYRLATATSSSFANRRLFVFAP